MLVQDATSAAAQGISLAPTPSVPDGLKERKTRVIGWEWRAFQNQAREDGLTLRHWSKMSDKSASYTFALPARCARCSRTRTTSTTSTSPTPRGTAPSRPSS